ncbi:ArsR family transcriptional regulator [Micromonospora sediminicola]|uniref:ArsR family transcriptional regulator n=1 Tax=Micromonospora sediminicola TaxID=946078 RepID=UPI003404D7F1
MTRLDDNVPKCSFHLRQPAKYGFAERAAAAESRERPRRATARDTSWDDDSDDPAKKAATDQLNGVMLALLVRRVRDYLAVRDDEPVEWRTAAGFGDALLRVTAAEPRGLTEEIEGLLARYDERVADPARRPPGSRPVQIIQLAVPRGPVPVAGQRAGTDRD